MPCAPLRWRLHVERDDRDGVAVFTVAGRLGTLSSGDLIERLTDAITGGARRIVVDLSGVDYVSSAGLMALEAIMGRLLVVGGDLVLCGLTEPVRLAVDFGGLLEHVSEVPSLDDALARLATRGAHSS